GRVFWDLAAVSNKVVKVGGRAASSAHALALDWSSDVTKSIFGQAGFSRRVPGKVLTFGEDTGPVLESVRRACELIGPSVRNDVIDEMLSSLEVEYCSVVGRRRLRGRLAWEDSASPPFTAPPPSPAQSQADLAACPRDLDPGVPRWDRQTRQLRFAGELCKRLAGTATAQMTILDAFEEEGWPERI